LNATIEIGGPEQDRLDELIQRELGARHDSREVIADPHARYFGTELDERSLVAGDDAQLGEIRFEDWLGRVARQIPDASVQPAVVAAPRIDRAPLTENEFRINEMPPGSVLLGTRRSQRARRTRPRVRGTRRHDRPSTRRGKRSRRARENGRYSPDDDHR
jgi:hypothetical protein